jgi:hypothetical protein
VADTESVSVGALVQYVGEVLGRSHALFGDPPDAAARAATGGGARLNDAGRLLAAGRRRFASLSGDFATGYDGFARRAGPALDRLAGLDDRVGGVLTDAAGSDRRGRAESGAVLNAAASDTAALAAWSGTPAGQQLLLTQLRVRLIQQRRVITAYRARDAQLAAMMRATRYCTGFPPGARGMPRGGSPLGTAGLTGLGSPPGLTGLPSMSGLTRAAANRTTRRIHLAARHDPRAVPAGPGGAAVAAALTRRGDPYVWGAKGPNWFDCSGLGGAAWTGSCRGPDFPDGCVRRPRSWPCPAGGLGERGHPRAAVRRRGAVGADAVVVCGASAGPVAVSSVPEKSRTAQGSGRVRLDPSQEGMGPWNQHRCSSKPQRCSRCCRGRRRCSAATRSLPPRRR